MSLNPFKHNQHRPPPSPSPSTVPQAPGTPQSARLKSEFDDQGNRGPPPSYGASTGGSQGQRPGGGGNGDGDDRPLPDGWVRQWNPQYSRYFYVDTKAQGGPKSSWIHPMDDPNFRPPNRGPSPYASPQGPPPPQQQGGYETRGSFGQQGGYYSGPPPQQQYYQGPPPQQQYYQQPPPQQYYQQAPPQQAAAGRSGVNPLLLGGGALLGGLLIGDMIGDSGDHGDDGGDWGRDDGGDFGDGGFF